MYLLRMLLKMGFFTKTIPKRKFQSILHLGYYLRVGFQCSYPEKKKVIGMFRFWYFVKELVTVFYRPCTLAVPLRVEKISTMFPQHFVFIMYLQIHLNEMFLQDEFPNDGITSNLHSKRFIMNKGSQTQKVSSYC